MEKLSCEENQRDWRKKTQGCYGKTC